MKKVIATRHICNWGGNIIIEANDDYVVAGYDFGNGIRGLRRRKLHYNAKGNPYFVMYGHREYLSEYMRTDFGRQ